MEKTTAAKPPITLQIRSMHRDFSKKESLVADFILHDPKKVSRMTISEIAGELGLATSTVFQFTRKLGYKGFRDFRNDLLTEAFDPEISVHENVRPEDDSASIASKVFSSSIQSLHDTLALLRKEDLDAACRHILNAETLSFFGVGGSNVVAFDAYHKFLRSPIRCQYGTDYHIQLMQASLMGPNDCAIITTHTGLTKDTLKLADVVKRTGAKAIAITSYPSSQLAEACDVTLVSVSEETSYRSESLASRIAQLAIIDTLFTTVMFREENAADALHRVREVINSTKMETA